MPEYLQRNIDTPAVEWLTVEQSADYLGLSVTEFMERVRLGVFPPGSSQNLRESQWYWTTIQSLSWLRTWLDVLYIEKKKERISARRRRGKKETKVDDQ